MGSRKGITVAAAERFRELDATGQSRRAAKMTIRSTVPLRPDTPGGEVFVGSRNPKSTYHRGTWKNRT